MANEPMLDESTWLALTGYQITMPLRGLLILVPRFKETLAAIIRKEEVLIAPINFASSSEAPMVVDKQNRVVKSIVKGKEVPDSTIEGGSGVNVISKATCDRLVINQWDVCPFLL